MTAARAHSPMHPQFTLMQLPYEESALAPAISARTVGLHHGKHHKTYVETLNKLIEGTDLAGRSLEDVIKATTEDPARKEIFNNAGQVWNHDFFWRSLDPKGGGKPKGRLAALIDESFGGFDAFKKRFAETGVRQFGSGWAWLCTEGGKLTLRRTGNARNLVTEAGVVPLLAIDVWEHAYYLDYQNKRPDFVAAVIDKLVNWRFAEANLG